MRITTAITAGASIALLACAPADRASQTQLTGAGATFPYPMYTKWFSEYGKANPGVQINYQSLGSGAGIKQVTEGTVDFGATDGPMTDAELAEYRTKRGHDVLHFPTVIGAVVPVYNVPGISQPLKFTAASLAGIFLGTIRKWNDPAIAHANSGITLPDLDIVVAHRSDGSGTTYVWADYLSKVSPEWAQRVGTNKSVAWPVGLGGKGNEGVAGLVKQTEGSIGYVELVYAEQNGIAHGAVENTAGNFIRASLGAVSAAAAGAAVNMPEDFRVSITNAPGAESYPIASFTWLLIPSQFADAGKRTVIIDFLRWMLADGQTMTEALTYAKLPPAVVSQAQAAIDRVQ